MIVPIIASTVILLNSAHVFISWLRKPPGTVFTAIAHYYADYFLYVSLMAQKGWLFTEHLFTNEQIPPTWIYWLYTILGKLGNPFVVYNASIIVFSGALLWLWWHVITQTVSDRATRVTAFLMLTTASGFLGFDFWFSPLPALNRLGGVPHQIFQTALLLSVILLSHRKLSLLCIIVSFFAALANPIQMLLLTVAISGALLAEKRAPLWETIHTLAAIGFPAFAGAAITNAAFSNDPILLAAKAWETAQMITISPWQFFLATGPIAFLIPFGITLYTGQHTTIRMILALYGALSLAAFFSPIPHLLGTSPVRWLSPAAYTILPILASLGVTRISSQHLRDRRRVDYFIKGVVLTLYSIATIPPLLNQIIARQNAPRNLLYIPNEVVQRMHNLPGSGVILTDPKTPYDVVVPVFTQRKSFTGHPIHTLYPQIKEELRKKYFEGKMTEEEKQKFLKDHNITTIIF